MSIQQQTIIAPTTGALVSAPQNTFGIGSVVVSADNLTGSETVTLQFYAGGILKQVTDITGTAINLTATLSGVVLAGGPDYVFSKSITAGLCGVYLTPR